MKRNQLCISACCQRSSFANDAAVVQAKQKSKTVFGALKKKGRLLCHTLRKRGEKTKEEALVPNGSVEGKKNIESLFKKPSRFLEPRKLSYVFVDWGVILPSVSA